MILGKGQQRAFNLALQGTNLFITGPGGVGKSVVLEEIIRALRDKHWSDRVAVTASTGIAALRIGGGTIHSFLGTGLAGSIAELKVAYTKNKVYLNDERYSALVNARCIVIDEVSMLSGDYLDMMDYHLRDICQISKPFAGKHMIFCGDFLQLPPVVKKDTVQAHFAFQSEAWKEAGIVRCGLGENFRQADDIAYARHLNSIRYGELTRGAIRFLAGRVGAGLTVEDPLQLYAKNVNVDRLNEAKLGQLPGTASVYPSVYWGSSKLREPLERSCIVPSQLKLKPNAKVLLCRNDPEAGFVNGDRGTFLGLRDRMSCSRHAPAGSREKVLCVLVEGGRNEVEVPVHRFEWCNPSGDVLAAMLQYPVKLAWAVTIHKSQGMTLRNIVADLSGCFEAGQAYVALSRVRTSGGLSLRYQVTRKQVFAHPECVGFYPRVKRNALR